MDKLLFIVRIPIFGHFCVREVVDIEVSTRACLQMDFGTILVLYFVHARHVRVSFSYVGTHKYNI